MADKIFAVVNPAAGGGKTGKNWPRCEDAFFRAGLELEVEVTGYRGHAVRLVRQALHRGYRRIMAVGGDGTVNEVVNGFFEGSKMIAPQARLIIFGQGSGSDYIKSIGISSKVDEIIRIARKDRVNYFDLGFMTYIDHYNNNADRYFINLADAGIGGETVYNQEQGGLLIGSSWLRYISGLLRTMINYKNKVFRLEVDGEELLHRRLNSIIIANGKYFAGGMKMAPGARLDNGEFEIIIIGDLNPLQIIFNLYKAYQGNHLEHDQIEVARGQEVILDAEETVYLDVDGDAVGKLPARFEILPGKLPVLTI